MEHQVIDIIHCIVCGKTRKLTSRQYGKRDGRFCSCSCSGIYHSGPNNPAWKGGIISKSKKRADYILQYDYKTRKHVRQNRMIIEKHLKRKLQSNEIVHHINGIKNDNRLSNLKIMSRSEHAKLHNIKTKLNKKYVMKILKEYWEKSIPRKILAQKYKVTHDTIYKITMGKTWKNVFYEYQSLI